MIVRRAILVTAAALIALAAAPAQSQAAPCDAPVTSVIACENSKPGTPRSTWDIYGVGDDTIQGYATSMSVNKGSTVSFKVKTPASAYHIDIYRLGYYGGDGARLVAANVIPTATLPQTQPPCATDANTGLIDCGTWGVSASWNVPSTAVSGVYIARLIRNDTGGASHITFVVRDDASHSAIALQTSDATWQAYNTYGGNSLYQCTTAACPDGNPHTYKAAYAVSYNRPFNTADDDGGRSWLFSGAEYSMIRYLERNGYDVSYTSNVDTHRRGNLLLNHKTFISSGHDEYWSQTQRDNVTAARNAGVNLAFFTGNEMYWKTRWAPSGDGTSTPDRTIISYKDTHFDEQVDPVEPTGTWRDPRLSAAGAQPENALTGQSFLVNLGSAAITVPFEYKNLRLWKNTAVASLTTGQRVTLAPQTLGYEWDEDADNGSRPAGQVKLSSTTVSGLEVFTDYGSNTKLNGTATHNLTMYRAPGGARVFGAGTVQWAWGLDDDNPIDNPADRNMQQATVNLLADMDAQPATIASGLVAASKSTDATAPTSSISSPAANATVADGTRITVSGVASDTGGGVVAGVEVSTDGGTSWHPATGTSSWTYSWIAHGNPKATLRVRATDDSGNLQTPGAGIQVNVNCPCSIWGNQVTPDTPDSQDPNPAEVGVKFKSDTYGSITGIRFYKSAANTGTHIGSLWTADGTRLAQATFNSESASGWQTATFSTPVVVTPGTTYVASYFAPNGHFAITPAYLYPQPAPGPNGGSATDSAPLHALRSGPTSNNGVFAYSGSSTFPTDSFNATNYWVDVLLTPVAAPGQVTGVSAVAAGRTSANVSWTAPSTGGAPTSYRITPYVGSTAQTPKTITGTPPATSTTVTGLTQGTTYTFKVEAINPTGTGPASAASNPVTPAGAVVPTAPTGVQAAAASNSAKVSWTAPDSDGDSAITGYTVIPFKAGVAQDPINLGTATSTTVTGLTNGTSYTFRVTATNGVGSSPASAASNAVTPQLTVFDLQTPAQADANDGSAVEVGVKFQADESGSVTGVRFYKADTNTGTHVGSLWTASGTRLAQATFENETASGWQTATFATPVNVTAGTTYVASYHAPKGHYSATASAFAPDGVDNAPLHALSNATSPNGVYSYSAAPSTFPTSSFNASNYWVDVTFLVPVPGAVSGVNAELVGQTSADVSWTAPTTGGQPSSYRITTYAGATAGATTTVTGTPPDTTVRINGLSSGTTYTFRVTPVNSSGAGAQSAASNAVTPTVAVPPTAPTGVTAQPATRSARVNWTVPSSNGDSPITSYTVTPYDGAVAQTPAQVTAPATSTTVTGLNNGTSYTFRVKATNSVGDGAASQPSNAVTPRATIFDFAAPAAPDSGDTNAVELGVKFKSDVTGTVTGVRFYKAAANTGTHVGSVWTTGGTRLAQATFTNESASGWQTATFATPVQVTADTTYVASYHAPKGHYAATGSAFSPNGVDNAPLHALSTATSANGVYVYTTTGGFPTNSWNAANYWVDVLFSAAPIPGQVTGVSATAGQASAAVNWTAPSTGGNPSSYKITPYIGTTAQAVTTVTGSPPATNGTVRDLTPGTAYTFKVHAVNSEGSGPQSSASNAVTPTGAAVPGAPTGVSATADTKSARVDWTAPADDGGGTLTGYTITPYIGATAQTTFDTSGSGTSARVTGLTNGTSYTFKVKARSTAGAGPDSAASGAVSPRYSIFDYTAPATADAGDGGAVELGVKFKADVTGTVTGVRFYKAAANTGTHVGSVWTTGGTRLAQATFTNESASGWQTATFATPVQVTAGTTYVASYHAPNGHYSATGSAFAPNGVDNAPLHALANSVSPSGVYLYTDHRRLPEQHLERHQLLGRHPLRRLTRTQRPVRTVGGA